MLESHLLEIQGFSVQEHFSSISIRFYWPLHAKTKSRSTDPIQSKAVDTSWYILAWWTPRWWSYFFNEKFTSIWGRFPFWLIFFKWFFFPPTTNQTLFKSWMEFSQVSLLLAGGPTRLGSEPRSCHTAMNSEPFLEAIWNTPWKFNIASENWWLEDEFFFGIPYFQGLC